MKNSLLIPISESFSRALNLLRLYLYFRVDRGNLRLRTLRKAPSFVRQYYEYCVEGIRDALGNEARGRLSIYLMSQDFSFLRGEKSLAINTEHTLVRKGGRDSEGSPIGEIPVVCEVRSEKYLVRIPGGFRRLPESNQIIEYSVPNLINVHQSDHRDLYLDKAHYIAPLLSPRMLNQSAKARDVSRIFTFMSLPESGDRRTEIIQRLNRSGVQTANIQGLVGDVSEAMSRLGILLNLHQTDHHHTLEELRVLPALLQGVLVVSEPSPLIEEVPYSRFITFASIEEMPGILSEFLATYEKRWNETFASGEFSDVISSLDESNKRAFAAIVRNLGF